MDYFIPKHVKGYLATDAQRTAAEAAGRDPDRVGMPYEFFRGIHHVPDALADTHHANALGIVPVEEMSDDDWRGLGLDKDAWLKANRPEAEEPSDEPETAADKPETAVDANPALNPVILPAPSAKAPATV